jgi:hypothetical protein
MQMPSAAAKSRVLLVIVGCGLQLGGLVMRALPCFV